MKEIFHCERRFLATTYDKHAKTKFTFEDKLMKIKVSAFVQAFICLRRVFQMLDSHYDWTPAATVSSVPELLRTLYTRRGITSNQAVKAFLRPSVKTVYDPFALHDMNKAVDRIRQAIKNQELITVYGDYDADGVTSTTLMTETLAQLGARVSYYIPDRFRDGYGPNKAAYERLLKSGTQLVVTVDNGVSGKSVIDSAVEAGMDVVITDHHQLPKELPTKAAAIVHPAYPGSSYPFKGLSGVGVAWKVAWALLGHKPMEKLDLVAIGELADVMPVNDENRWLIQTGLLQIEKTNRPGLRRLLADVGLYNESVDSTDVGFKIAPALNSMGRIGDSSQAIKVLAPAGWFEETEVDELVDQLADLNQKRKDMVHEISEQAYKLADQNHNEALILAGQGWHPGVVGLVAQNVLEYTGKPTVVASNLDHGPVLKGSGRSREGFDLYAALDPHRDLMVGFGGHPQACGLSVNQNQVAALQEAFNAEAKKQGFNSRVKPKLVVDAIVKPGVLNHIRSYQLVHNLQPFGLQNTEPIFELQHVTPTNFYQMGKHNEHLKFRAGGITCIDFFVDPHLIDDLMDQELDVCGHLTLNTFRGQTSVEMIVDDIRVN